MKRRKISNFEITPPKKGAFTIDTPPDIPKLHTLMLASGKRGGGKSVAVANFVKKLREHRLMDRVWLISPTYHSNAQIWDIASIAEADVIEPSVTALTDLTALVEAERSEWDAFQADQQLYKRFQRDMRDRPVSAMGEHDLLRYAERGFFTKPPKWKYEREVPPRLMVVVDDSMGTDLMRPRAGLTNFCIKHRHTHTHTHSRAHSLTH